MAWMVGLQTAGCTVLVPGWAAVAAVAVAAAPRVAWRLYQARTGS